MHHFIVVSYEFVSSIVFGLPRYRVFSKFKSFFLHLVGGKIGKRATFYPGVFISPGRNLIVGDDVDFALNVLITTAGGVEIGDRVLIGYGTHIYSSNHRIPPRSETIFESGHVHSKVVIKNDVWIGGNCVVLPGITIGEGAVVAAGSIVTKDVSAFSIVGGNPARKIRDRL